MDHDRRQEARRVDDLTVAMMKRDIDELRALNTRLLAEIEALKSDRDKALRWGVVTLGVAVIGMATWIFNMLFSGKVGH